ncbi:MAG: putative PAS/PAC sensor protein [Candidatus Gallionella acididurans]|uniref:Putative PAS/PAC sensor protein n=1 Tax=Candidatus Gallionella acididurans TaxID=1796491 RepID=A0A139BRA6_9PROT|nr:MAG: putative PAS/PAC sensor protein [Candidatus Gallionella acididurans]
MSDDSLQSEIKYHQSVKRLLVILIGSVFAVNLLAALLLEILPKISRMYLLLLDSALQSVLIFPIFYLLVFRPLLKCMNKLKQAEDSLRTVSVAFETRDPILITDAQANILRANKMFLKISGYSLDELIGKNPRILKTERYGEDYYKKMWGHLLHHGSWAGETRIRDKEGNDFAIGMVITAVKNDRHETTHYVATYSF